MLNAHWAKVGRPADTSIMMAIGFVLDSVGIPDGKGNIVGVGTFSCVAVELPDGTLEPVSMQNIKFVDKLTETVN